MPHIQVHKHGMTEEEFQEVGHKNNSLDVIMAENGTGGRAQKLENYIQDISDFAITITFTDANIRMYKNYYLRTMVLAQIQKTRNIIKYCFIPEISKVGRFHYHGSIKVTKRTAVENLRKKLSQFGICKVKLVDNAPKWAHYVMKSYDHDKCIITNKPHTGDLQLNQNLILRNY